MIDQEENKRKHLEFVQNVISRMSGNLFYLKGWTITLIAGLYALGAKDADTNLIYLAIFPIVIFWVLDGYFLSQERCYRALYNHARLLKNEDIDFSMDASKYREISRNTWLSSIFSTSLVSFYGLLILSLFVVMFFIKHNICIYIF